MKTFTVGDFNLKVAEELRLEKSINKKFKLGSTTTLASLEYGDINDLYDLHEGCDNLFEEDGKLYLDISSDHTIAGNEILLETFINQPMIKAHLSFLEGVIYLQAESELRYNYDDDVLDTVDEDEFIEIDDEIVLYGLENINNMYSIYEYKVL